jgi:hypothetical protein
VSAIIITLTDEQAEAVKGAIRVATQCYRNIPDSERTKLDSAWLAILNSQALARRGPKGWTEIEADTQPVVETGVPAPTRTLGDLIREVCK